MRMRMVSDLHDAMGHFDRVLEQAPRFDVVVLARDRLELSSALRQRTHPVSAAVTRGRVRRCRIDDRAVDAGRVE